MMPDIVMSFECSSAPSRINIQKDSDIKSVTLKFLKYLWNIHSLSIWVLFWRKTKMSLSVLHCKCCFSLYIYNRGSYLISLTWNPYKLELEFLFLYGLAACPGAYYLTSLRINCLISKMQRRSHMPHSLLMGLKWDN